MKYGSICARTRLTQVQIKAFLTNAQSFAHGDAKIFVIDLQFRTERNRKKPVASAVTTRRADTRLTELLLVRIPCIAEFQNGLEKRSCNLMP
jgi:hypothetical protein